MTVMLCGCMAAGTGKPAASTPTVQTYPTLPAPTQPTQATVIATTTPTEPKLPAGPVEYREIYWSYKQFLPQYSEYEGEYFILEFPEKMGELEAHLVNNLNCPEYRAKIILKEISEYDRYESGIMLITFWTEHYMHNAIDVSRQADGSYLIGDFTDSATATAWADSSAASTDKYDTVYKAGWLS